MKLRSQSETVYESGAGGGKMARLRWYAAPATCCQVSLILGFRNKKGTK